MTSTPLNPDALTQRDIMAGFLGSWIDEWDDGKSDTAHVATHIANRLAEKGITTLAVSQPVVNSVEANKALLREAMAIGWDDAIKAMQYPDGSPVEIMINQNPYRPAKEQS